MNLIKIRKLEKVEVFIFGEMEIDMTDFGIKGYNMASEDTFRGNSKMAVALYMFMKAIGNRE